MSNGSSCPKKYVSKDGSCPNNICPMVVHVQKNVSKGGSLIYINEVLVRSCSLNSEMILK